MYTSSVRQREFLTGFHKRKVQRQKKAKEELDHQLREERKRLKQETRESYKKLVVSHRPIPELEEFEAKEYDLETHTVSILEVSAADLAQKNNWIGVNKVQYEEVKVENDDRDDEEEKGTVPGMEFRTEKDVRRVIKKQATKLVQNSKAFQTKNKLERQKNKKKSMKQKNQRIKLQSKNKKGKRGKKNK
uniref:Nucleolar protein 12 n=1 Tax=Timema genevievae TaxID=629358 RepID=A0A7R9PM71_TIMGE|nr:unnamed protein product [Timema genevievae]